MTSFVIPQALATNRKGGQAQRWQKEGATKVERLGKMIQETQKSIASFRTPLYNIVQQLALLDRHLISSNCVPGPLLGLAEDMKM